MYSSNLNAYEEPTVIEKNNEENVNIDYNPKELSRNKNINSISNIVTQNIVADNSLEVVNKKKKQTNTKVTKQKPSKNKTTQKNPSPLKTNISKYIYYT